MKELLSFFYRYPIGISFSLLDILVGIIIYMPTKEPEGLIFLFGGIWLLSHIGYDHKIG